MDLRVSCVPWLLAILSVVTLLKIDNPLYRKNPGGPITYPEEIGLKVVAPIPEYQWRLLPEKFVSCAVNYDEGRKHHIVDIIQQKGKYEFRSACKKYLKEKFIPEIKDVVLHDLIFSIKAALSAYLVEYEKLRKELFGEKSILYTDSSDKKFLKQVNDLRFVLSRKLISPNDGPTPDFDIFEKLVDEPLRLYIAVVDSVPPPVISSPFKEDCPSKILQKGDEVIQKRCANLYLTQLRQNDRANKAVVESGENFMDPLRKFREKLDVLTSWDALENAITYLMNNAGRSEEEIEAFELKIPMTEPCYPKQE